MGRDYLTRVRKYHALLKETIEGYHDCLVGREGISATVDSAKAAGLEKALEMLVEKFPELKKR